MPVKKQLITVCTAMQMEAEIIKGRLESEGIPALLSYESAGWLYGLTTNGLGEVKIMVPQHLVEEAKEILRISDKNNIELQEQARDKPTWIKPFCLMLLILWIFFGGAG